MRSTISSPFYVSYLLLQSKSTILSRRIYSDSKQNHSDSTSNKIKSCINCFLNVLNIPAPYDLEKKTTLEPPISLDVEVLS